MIQDPQKPQATSATTELRPVDGGPENLSGATLLVEAYIVLWLILMGWVLMVWRKQKTLHARIDDLERVIDNAERKRSSSRPPAKAS